MAHDTLCAGATVKTVGWQAKVRDSIKPYLVLTNDISNYVKTSDKSANAATGRLYGTNCQALTSIGYCCRSRQHHRKLPLTRDYLLRIKMMLPVACAGHKAGHTATQVGIERFSKQLDLRTEVCHGCRDIPKHAPSCPPTTLQSDTWQPCVVEDVNSRTRHPAALHLWMAGTVAAQ